MAAGRIGLIGLGLEIAGGAAVNRWPEYAIPVMLLGGGFIFWGVWGWYNDRRESYGKPRRTLDQSQIIIGSLLVAATFLVIAAIAYAWKPSTGMVGASLNAGLFNSGQGTGGASEKPAKLRPQYLKNISFRFEKDKPLIMTATPSTTTDHPLRIFVDYAWPAGNGAWNKSPRIYINEIQEAFKQQRVQVQLAYKPKTSSRFVGYWGDQNQDSPVEAISRVRVVILGDGKEAQHIYFMLFENSDRQLRVVPEADLEWIAQWKAEAG